MSAATAAAIAIPPAINTITSNHSHTMMAVGDGSGDGSSAHSNASKSIDSDKFMAMDENVISVLKVNDLSDSSTNNNSHNSDDGILDASMQFGNRHNPNNNDNNNHADCVESQRLLMHLDGIDDGNNASRKKANAINSMIAAANDLELVKTNNSSRHKQVNGNENNCSDSSNSSRYSVHSRNSSNSKRNIRNHQSGHNVIESDAMPSTNITRSSPTNPFRVDYQEFESSAAQSKPNNCHSRNRNDPNQLSNGKNRNVVEANEAIRLGSTVAKQLQTQNDDNINYQRNAKSLGYLIDCSCSSEASDGCKCLQHGLQRSMDNNNTWILRRTKSSTGIMEYGQQWTHDIGTGDGMVKHGAIVYSTATAVASNTMANNQINNRPFGDAYNGRLRSIFGKTNRQHSMHLVDVQRNSGSIKDFVQQRWQSFRLLSQQKFQQLSKQRKPAKPLEVCAVNRSGGGSGGSVNDGRIDLQSISIKPNIQEIGVDGNGKGRSNDTKKLAHGKLSLHANTVDECRPLMTTTITSSHQQLNAFDLPSSNTPQVSTNPFLLVPSDDQITGANNIDANSCRASNEAKDTIFEQLSPNADNELSAPNNLNKFDNNERNVGDDLNRMHSGSPTRHRHHSHRMKSKHRHNNKKSNNSLAMDNGDEWNALTMPNHCATLMKYGSKRQSHKDYSKRIGRHHRQHNQSSDNLPLVDDITGYQYVVKDGSPRKVITIGSRQHLNTAAENEMGANRMRVYSAYGKNQRCITGSIGDIPTCPFQRQDYTNPNDDDDIAHHRQRQTHAKKSKKDLLLNFAMQKGKYLSSSIGLSQPTDNSTKTTYKMGHTATRRKFISNDTGITMATSMNNMSNESLFGPKMNAFHGHRMVAKQQHHQHHVHYREKDDKTYLDRTKKSLRKIGQKCGLKMNGSGNEEGGMGDCGNTMICSSTTLSKYEGAPVHELVANKSNVDSTTAAITGEVSNNAINDAKATIYTNDHHNSDTANMAKFPYKSYRSEIDLTKNLHYLNEFLNENFDKSQAMANNDMNGSTIGKYKMDGLTNERHRHKHRYLIDNNDGHSKRDGSYYHRHRTRSVSKSSIVVDGMANDEMSGHGSNGGGGVVERNSMKRANDSPEYNYTGCDSPSLLSSAVLQLQRDYTLSLAGYASNINDNLNDIMGQQQQQQQQQLQHHQQQNQYAISSSSTSDPFASYKQAPPPLASTSSSSTSTAHKYPGTDAPMSNAIGSSNGSGSGSGIGIGTNGERGATKSHTASSSLSSSDYASVYSPCSNSQSNEMNGKCSMVNSGVNLMQAIDGTSGSSDGGQVASGCGNNDMLLKQKRYTSITGSYHHKRNVMNMELPVYDVRPTYYSDARPLNRIDGLRLDDDDGDDDDENDDGRDDHDFDGIQNDIGVLEHSGDNSIAINDCIDSTDATKYIRSNNTDNLSTYQFENQLSYHEDYLQHYHNRRSLTPHTPTHIQSLFSPIAVNQTLHPTQLHAHYANPSIIQRSTSISPNYGQSIRNVRPQISNYPQSHRVVMSKPKNGRNNPNDVVLEYEC